MRRALVVLVVGSILLTGSPSMAQSPADLTQVFDQYLAAVKAGDFRRVLAVYRTPVREQVLADYASPQAQAEFLEALKEMAPDAYEAPTVAPSSGQAVLLRVMGKKHVPPEIQKQQNLPPVVQMAMVIEFAQEGGQWKMGPPAFAAAPPAEAKEPRRPRDLVMGTRADYRDGASTELGGPVIRAERQASGTVYVIRVLDEEVAAFVPARLVRPAFGPGKILVLRGATHKQDPQKFWAEQAKLHE